MTTALYPPCSRAACPRVEDTPCWACARDPRSQEAGKPGAARGRSPLLPRALVEFHDEHRVTFVKYVRSRGVTRDEAEDVVNQAFMQIHRAQQAFLTARNRTAFAFKLLGDVVVDHFRALDRRPRTLALVDRALTVSASDGGIDALICRLDVEKALNQLPPRQADCLRLELFLDMSTTQIAYYLDISPSAVRSHRSVGRQQLTGHLAAYNPHMSPGEEQHG